MDFHQFDINSKFERDYLAKKIIEAKNFNEVYHFIKSNDNRLGNKVAWTLTKALSSENNQWLINYYDDILIWLPNCKTQGIHRSMMKIISENKILPSKNESGWIDLCYHFLQGAEVAVAVKVFSMELLSKFCLKYPDLINEFLLVIDEGCAIYSKAYTARAKKIYKKFGKLAK